MIIPVSIQWGTDAARRRLCPLPPHQDHLLQRVPLNADIHWQRGVRQVFLQHPVPAHRIQSQSLHRYLWRDVPFESARSDHYSVTKLPRELRQRRPMCLGDRWSGGTLLRLQVHRRGHALELQLLKRRPSGLLWTEHGFRSSLGRRRQLWRS